MSKGGEEEWTEKPTYSQSGGESGACSSHGGVMRPLYSH